MASLIADLSLAQPCIRRNGRAGRPACRRVS